MLVDFTDTSNNYTLKIPDKWGFIFPKNKTELKLTVQEKPSIHCSSNFINIKIVDSLNTSFKEVYAFQLNFWSKQKDFRILDTGSLSVNENNHDWFIEQHYDPVCNIFVFYMCSICFRDGKLYILEMESLQKDGLESRRRLFLEIVKSFKST
jgi:hypothetical protein